MAQKIVCSETFLIQKRFWSTKFLTPKEVRKICLSENIFGQNFFLQKCWVQKIWVHRWQILIQNLLVQTHFGPKNISLEKLWGQNKIGIKRVSQRKLEHLTWPKVSKTPSRYLPDTSQTPPRNFPDTLQTPPPDTYGSNAQSWVFFQNYQNTAFLLLYYSASKKATAMVFIWGDRG